MNEISGHARSRMQQRSIPETALHLLLDYGTVHRSRGADRYYFDHASRQRALRQRALRGKEKLLNTYAVVADDGQVITVAWRTERWRQ
jgi:hypothetical protein